MAGIQIPLGGDLGPLLEAFAKIRSHTRRLGGQMQVALRPVRSTFTTTFKAASAVASAAFRTMVASARAAVSTIRGAFAGLKKLIPGGGMLGPLVGVAGAAGAIALAVSQIKAGSEIASGFERAHMALTALTGSGTEADRVLGAMKDTWQRTGVAVAEQTRTIQKFIALGFDSSQAVQLQGNILDIAGAVGMTTEEAELLGSALAQVKAKGVVSMEELRQQIAEKGVPVFQALAEKIGVSEAALIKMVESGKVPADQLLGIFMNMEGAFARFRGGADKLGSTFGGMIARLRAAWGLLIADFAAPINDALKPLLQEAIAMFGSMRQRAAGLGKAIGDSLLAAFALLKSGKTFDLMRAGLRIAFAGATDLLMRGLRGAVAFLATALPPVFSAAISTLKDPRFWKGIGNMLQGVGKLFAAQILAVAPGFGNKTKARDLRQEGLTDLYVSEGQIQSSGRGANMADVIARSLFDGVAAAVKASGGAMSSDLKNALASWQELTGTVGQEIEALRAKAAGSAATAPLAAGKTGPAGDGLAGAARQWFGLFSSTARIGGGGFGMSLTPMVGEQRKTNGLLKELVTQGRAPQVATFAR